MNDEDEEVEEADTASSSALVENSNKSSSCIGSRGVCCEDESSGLSLLRELRIRKRFAEACLPSQGMRVDVVCLLNVINKPAIFPVSLNKIAILWMIDKEKDGLFSLSEVLAFSECLDKRGRVCRNQDDLEALALMTLWENTRGMEGKDIFASWVEAILVKVIAMQKTSVRSLDKETVGPSRETSTFGDAEKACLLYDLFDVYEQSDVPMHEFLRVLQEDTRSRTNQKKQQIATNDPVRGCQSNEIGCSIRKLAINYFRGFESLMGPIFGALSPH